MGLKVKYTVLTVFYWRCSIDIMIMIAEQRGKGRGLCPLENLRREKMLDITEAENNEVQGILVDMDWCLVQLATDGWEGMNTRIVTWLDEWNAELVWLTGRNQGLTEPVCTWEDSDM